MFNLIFNGSTSIFSTKITFNFRDERLSNLVEKLDQLASKLDNGTKIVVKTKYHNENKEEFYCNKIK
jgi:hypothetical protein